MTFYPWQLTTARYSEATNADGLPLYREIAVIVARRNGKTTLLLPYAVHRLLEGRKLTHVAQTLRLPGEFFRELVAVFEKHYPQYMLAKRGVSWRAGQEEMRLNNGGIYRLVAAGNGAARGLTNDIVMIDELREMPDLGVLAALRPTVAQSPYRQMFYISNAGTEDSACLKSIQDRATAEDPSLAYLEWSAAPGRAPDDLAGWLEANPAVGHNEALLESLEEDYRAALLGGTMPDFETERLCRYQVSLKSRLLPDGLFEAQEFLTEPGPPRTAYMAIKMFDERVSAAVAWSDDVGRITLDIHDAHASNAQRAAVGADLKRIEMASRSRVVAFDPYTEADLTRYLLHPKAMLTRDYAAASEKFINLATERKLRIHDPAGVLGPDLARTVRKGIQSGAFIAARAGDEPNTAAEAAIKAAWLASAPKAPFNPQVVY